MIPFTEHISKGKNTNLSRTSIQIFDLVNGTLTYLSCLLISVMSAVMSLSAQTLLLSMLC